MNNIAKVFGHTDQILMRFKDPIHYGKYNAWAFLLHDHFDEDDDEYLKIVLSFDDDNLNPIKKNALSKECTDVQYSLWNVDTVIRDRFIETAEDELMLRQDATDIAVEFYDFLIKIMEKE